MQRPRVAPSTPLDPGIEAIVVVLNEAGIHTYESCEGGDGHSYRDPTVRFYGPPSDGWRAIALCKDRGLPVQHLSRCWDMDNDEPSGPYWQLEFRRDN